jgi:hypothetical protein
LNNFDQLRNLEIIERPNGEIVHADFGGDGVRTTIDNPIVVRMTQYEHRNALPSYGHFYAVHLVGLIVLFFYLCLFLEFQ